MKIQCNESTFNSLQENRSNWTFDMEKRLIDGKHGIKVKGKGLQYTWWINKAIQYISTTEDEISVDNIPKNGNQSPDVIA